MESVNEVKEALSARSRTATLDELRSEGRKRVRLIKAEHVAAMIADAVHAAIEHSDLVTPEEVNALVERSRQEFKSILKEREAEVKRAHEVEELLSEREQELVELRHRFEQVSAALAAVRVELEQVREELGSAGATDGAAAAAVGGGASADLVMSLVREMATLKASMMQREQQAPAAAAAPAGGDFAAALEKLTGSLNDRLEKLGKKMGVSSAVESDNVDFGSLFAHADKAMESNMDNIEVKQKAAGGIAANLARLKKLKGG